jgi:hypothetical protein
VAHEGMRLHPDLRGRALGRLAAGAATLLLVLAACGGSSASPSTSTAPPTTPEVTPTASPSPVPTPSPLETPQPTQVAVGDCTPAPPTDLSLDWVSQASLSGDYRFSRPADWADLSASLTLATNVSVSPETFTETGLATDARLKVDAARSFDGDTLVTAWVVDGVTTSTDELFPRELAWLKTQPQIKEVINEQLETCIGGSKARGFSSTWTTPNGDMNFVIFMLQRNGKMYEAQLTAKDPAQEVTFVELLNSWEFTEPAGPPTDLDDQFAATDFKVIGMAAKLDDTGDNPNQVDFQDTFPAMTEKLYVIYELDDETGDTVEFSWRRDGREFIANHFEYKATTTFAWGWITPDASGKFDTGNYSVTLSLVNSGDTITVPFTIE